MRNANSLYIDRLIAEILENSSKQQVIKITVNNLSTPDLEEILLALKQNDQLKRIDFSFPANCAQIELITQSLTNHPSLSKFHLSFIEVSNKAAQSIAEFIRNTPHIIELELTGNEFAPDGEGIKAISEAIAANKSLKSLSFLASRLGAKAAEHIAKLLKENQTLESLNLAFPHIGATGACHIIAALNDSKLQQLNLSDCNLGSEQIKLLANELKTNHELKSLILSTNKIDRQAAHHLAEIIRNNSHLREIDISNNPIGNITGIDANGKIKGIEGYIEIAQALTAQHSLEKLHMDVDYKRHPDLEKIPQILIDNSARRLADNLYARYLGQNPQRLSNNELRILSGRLKDSLQITAKALEHLFKKIQTENNIEIKHPNDLAAKQLNGQRNISTGIYQALSLVATSPQNIRESLSPNVKAIVNQNSFIIPFILKSVATREQIAKQEIFSRLDEVSTVIQSFVGREGIKYPAPKRDNHYDISS